MAEFIKKNFIIFKGSSPREGEIYENHGLVFKKGVIYEVSEEVYEFLKAQKRYFIHADQMSDRKIDFPKKKKSGKK